jgi:hypothetical protein
MVSYEELLIFHNKHSGARAVKMISYKLIDISAPCRTKRNFDVPLPIIFDKITGKVNPFMLNPYSYLQYLLLHIKWIQFGLTK